MEHLEKQIVHLNICGMEYALRSGKDAAYLQALGTQLHEGMTQLMHNNMRISATQAAVLCALEAMDEAHEAQTTSENLRSRIQDYLEDAAQMKKEAELSRHEAELLHREIAELKRKKM